MIRGTQAREGYGIPFQTSREVEWLKNSSAKYWLFDDA